jgi:WD40 repeat protein
VRELKGHTASETISSVSFSNDGQYIASGGSSGTILIHSVRERHIAATLTPSQMTTPPSSLGELCFSTMKPNILGAAYDGGLVAFYDVASASPVKRHILIYNITSI